MTDVEAASELNQLKRRAVRGSVFEIGGYAASQVIRLGSNLVLSRLLFPEAFGVVALVQVFCMGLVLLSDVGIEPAVIQNPRGDEKRFLDTAWTMQAVRGCVLYAVAVAIAYPMAALYDEPQLAALTIVGSASVALVGFHSTSLYTLRRRLALGRLTAIDVGSQLAGVVVMLPLAYFYRNPWPLVAGSLASAVAKLAASHWVDIGYRNQFAMDREARSAITNFGKWVFGSSVLYFVNRQSDRLLLGHWLGMAELGVYSIAVFLSEAIVTAVTRLNTGILYPMLSKVNNQSKEALRGTYYEARLLMDAVSLPGAGLLIMLGPQIVNLLYDDRYAAAGWMLQAFGARVAMVSVLAPCESCLFAMGHARWGFIQNVGRTIWMVIAVPIGWKLGGLHGLVVASALVELPMFLIIWPAFRKLEMLRFDKELRAAAMLAAGLALGWAVSLFWTA